MLNSAKTKFIIIFPMQSILAGGPGLDYNMPSPAELSISFPVNSTDGAMDCVNITAIDDDIFDVVGEFFTIALDSPLLGGNSDGVALGSPSSAPSQY